MSSRSVTLFDALWCPADVAMDP